MSTKTSKPKTGSSNGTAAKNGTSANGNSPKKAKPKKSMYEKWIEKYGASDSKADRMMLETCRMLYEANNKPKAA